MKNDPFYLHIQKAGAELTLTSQERARMREAVRSYMLMKPRAVRAESERAVSSWFFMPRYALTLALALVVSSAGISYAAEGALPGDVLYPIKVGFNEPLAGALSLSSEARVAWATRVAEERIQEAAVLLMRGALPPEVETAIRDSFEAHIQKALVAIDAELSASPDLGTQAVERLEARLSEYERVLHGVERAREGAHVLASAVAKQREDVGKRRVKVEMTDTRSFTASTKAITASRLREAAKEGLKKVEVLAHTSEPTLASSSAVSLAARLESASTSLSIGERKLNESAFEEALGAFRDAFRTTEKIDVFLSTNSKVQEYTGRVVPIGGEKEGEVTDEKDERTGTPQGTGNSVPRAPRIPSPLSQ